MYCSDPAGQLEQIRSLGNAILNPPNFLKKIRNQGPPPSLQKYAYLLPRFPVQTTSWTANPAQTFTTSNPTQAFTTSNLARGSASSCPFPGPASLFPATVTSQWQNVPKSYFSRKTTLDNDVSATKTRVKKTKVEKQKTRSTKPKKEGTKSSKKSPKKAKKAKMTTVEEFAKLVQQEKNFKLKVADFAR